MAGYKEELSALKWFGKISMYTVVFIWALCLYRYKNNFNWGNFILIQLAWIVVLTLIYRNTVFIVNRYLYLLEHGLKATAKVMQHTIKYYWNNVPIYEFQLEINLATEAPYIANSKTMIAKDSLRYFDIGNEVDVRINKKNKQEVVIINKYASPPIINIFGKKRRHR